MYTGMYPSLQCWMELFHVPKHPLLVSHFLVQRQPAVGGSVGGRQEISGAFGESLPHASVLAANTKAKDGRAQPGFAVKASNRRKKWLDHKPDGGRPSENIYTHFAKTHRRGMASLSVVQPRGTSLKPPTSQVEAGIVVHHKNQWFFC